MGHSLVKSLLRIIVVLLLVSHMQSKLFAVLKGVEVHWKVQMLICSYLNKENRYRMEN